MLVFRLISVAIIYIGSVAKLSTVWDLADLSMGIMAIMNIVAIALLSPKALHVLQDYRTKRREGKNPEFHVKDTPEIINTETWE